MYIWRANGVIIITGIVKLYGYAVVVLAACFASHNITKRYDVSFVVYDVLSDDLPNLNWDICKYTTTFIEVF